VRRQSGHCLCPEPFVDVERAIEQGLSVVEPALVEVDHPQIIAGVSHTAMPGPERGFERRDRFDQKVPGPPELALNTVQFRQSEHGVSHVGCLGPRAFCRMASTRR
jgi:hypothetical protein